MFKKTTIVILFILLIGIFASAKEPEKGCRGFVELNTEFYVDKELSYPIIGPPFEYKENYWLYGLSTSHGYQFNLHLFLGGGIWFQFGGEKAGNAICETLLSSLTIGYRYDFGKRITLNFGAGVSFHGFRPEYSDFGSWQWKQFAAVRLGIEF